MPRQSTDGLAVVIGAGPGLGRSLALAYADLGLGVALVARNPARLEALAAEVSQHGAEVEVVSADAADPPAVRDAVGRLAAGSPVKVLSYNAATWGGRLSEVGLDYLRSATDVNVHSAVAAVQGALDSLRDHRGTVLITGGGFALYPSGDAGVLSIGKAALRATTLALAEELAPEVTVRTVTVAGTIAPGTPFDPDRIAKVFSRLVTDPGEEVEVVFTGSDQ